MLNGGKEGKMYTNKEWVFKEILDCGLVDLDLLDNMEDFDLDIIKDLMDDGALSLANIFREVFERTKTDVGEVIKESVDEIITALEGSKNDIIEILLSNDDSKWEEIVYSESFLPDLISQKRDLLVDYFSERQCKDEEDAVYEYEYIVSSFESLSPENDLCLDFNFQVSSLYVNDTEKRDLYYEFFGDELSEIERKTGLYFSGR